ncbi:MAG: LytTR family transcriptional regulator [Roseibium sp.]|uniref:LytTR family DNA-binding domain-containing protein n=1 Tax=Roseibium sp. TaxID=1936156 RepID=UPI002639E418|nr:LytTR family DNA-binding domain-containing protein [Roseibium sp.]MCV0428634.1 LytTR family transcriptional regulator [Roseibium sp.]
MTRSYTLQVTVLAISAALLLASTQVQRPEGWSITGLYSYWSVRILIEAALFVAFAELFSRFPGFRQRLWLTAALAAFVSLVPFALSITALDLILGLPELNGSIGLVNLPGETVPVSDPGDARINSFLLELIYLSDNHLALCLLLSVPKMFAPSIVLQSENANPGAAESDPVETISLSPETIGEEPTDLATHLSSEISGNGYHRHLERPLEGPLVRVEAQEHYVRLISQIDSCMLLYRFNDIVSELSGDLGMQVHRSHWVAYSAIEKPVRESGRLWLLLTDGSKIPVSRKHVEDVQQHLSKTRVNTKKAAS